MRNTIARKIAKEARRKPAPLPAIRSKTHASLDGQTIDAAYGLVQGAFGTGCSMMSDEGHVEWNKPEVQKAAMEAAKAFLAKLSN